MEPKKNKQQGFARITVYLEKSQVGACIHTNNYSGFVVENSKEPLEPG